jgi:hypothetical protein
MNENKPKDEDTGLTDAELLANGGAACNAATTAHSPLARLLT